MSRWLPLLAALLWASPLRAEAPEVPSLDSLVESLRGMGLVLRRAREKLDADVSLDGHDVLERLNQAQRWSLAEDHPKVALRLLQLLSRPGFARSRAYPDALAALADAEWALGLADAARTHLREALGVQGQAPTHWRDRLARYLDLVGSRPALPELRALWAEYQRLGPADPPDGVDQALRYRFARALHFAQARAEARALFEAVPEDDPHHLRALYFLGVIDVADGEWMRAAVTFEVALTAFNARDPLPPTPAEQLEADGGPRLVTLSPEETGEPPPEDLVDLDDRVDRQRRVGALIHLALARLAAAREDWPTAWDHYRQVPRGGPEFTAALSEGSFILARQEEFEWCARLVDQLLAGRGVDVSAAQLTLWKLQLLARSERYEEAQAGYTAFAEGLERRQAGLAAAAAGDRLFPAEVLAWTAPAQVRQLRQLEAEIVTLRESLAEAAELRAELEALRRSQELLPVVAFGKAAHARLLVQTSEFAAVLARLAALPPADDRGGPARASPADLARLRASLDRLRARLETFGGRLAEYEAAYRARLAEVLDAEGPALEAQAQVLATDEAAARALANDLRVDATANLARYAAEARFGLVDIAYWRKEAITRQIRRLHERRRQATEPLEAVERELE